jgi:hypothetical protein
MTEDDQVRALALKLCKTATATDPSLGILMRALGRMTGILAGFLGRPVDEMLQTIVDEARKLERVDEKTHTVH